MISSSHKPLTTQQTKAQGTKLRDLKGVRTLDPSNGAASGLVLRSHGYRYQPAVDTGLWICVRCTWPLVSPRDWEPNASLFVLPSSDQMLHISYCRQVTKYKVPILITISYLEATNTCLGDQATEISNTAQYSYCVTAGSAISLQL